MLARRAKDWTGPVVSRAPKQLFAVATEDGVTLITLAVLTLDGRAAKQLRLEVAPRIPANSEVVIDFGPAVFFDADGLQTLWRWIEIAQSRATSLRFCTQSKAVTLLMHLTRLFQAVPVYGTMWEALAAIKRERIGAGVLQATAALYPSR